MDASFPDGQSFARGSIVLVTLNTPREKFWGAVLDLNVAGLSIRGIDLNSFDDFADMVRTGEGFTPAAVFFPMHRVERIELDAPCGAIPSLCDRFANKTGQRAAAVLQHVPVPAPGCTLSQAERQFVQATIASVQHDLGRAAQSLGITQEQILRVLATIPEGESR